MIGEINNVVTTVIVVTMSEINRLNQVGLAIQLMTPCGGVMTATNK